MQVLRKKWTLLNFNQSPPEKVMHFGVDKKPIFFDPILKKEMHLFGILIPQNLQGTFGNRSVVFLPTDEHEGEEWEIFQRAFFDLYYEKNLKRLNYVFVPYSEGKKRSP